MLLVVLVLPIAAYLFVLGRINRRPHPIVVSGPWDFAGILLAASGLLLVGGPALLMTLCDTWRDYQLSASAPTDTENAVPHLSDETEIADLLFLIRATFFVAYFVVVVGAAAFVLYRRRRLTAIYNVDAGQIETILGDTLERWQVPFVQTGNLLTFEPESEPSPPAVGIVAADDQPLRAAGTRTVRLVERTTKLELEASARMCHVTMQWDPPDSPLRREVETQLQRGLANAPAPVNPAGEVFQLLAGSLFFLCLAGVAAIVLLRLWPR